MFATELVTTAEYAWEVNDVVEDGDRDLVDVVGVSTRDHY
jgi:hypothetical protein